MSRVFIDTREYAKANLYQKNILHEIGSTNDPIGNIVEKRTSYCWHIFKKIDDSRISVLTTKIPNVEERA